MAQGVLCPLRRGTFERTNMMQRSWKNVALIVLGLVVMIGLFLATLIVAGMCRSGIGWPICYLQ